MYICTYSARYSYRARHARVRRFTRWKRESPRVGDVRVLKCRLSTRSFRVQRSVAVRPVPRAAPAASSCTRRVRNGSRETIPNGRGWVEGCRKRGERTCRRPREAVPAAECAPLARETKSEISPCATRTGKTFVRQRMLTKLCLLRWNKTTKEHFLA